MEDRTDYKKLYERYLNGQLTPEEYAALLLHFHRQREATELREPIEETFATTPPESWENQGHVQEAFHRVGTNLRQVVYQDRGKVSRQRVLRFLPYAAALLITLSVGIYIYQDSDRQVAVDNLAATEILPGGNRATLTLADGRTIDLSSEQAGIVVADGITYLDGSKVMENEGLGEENGILNAQLSILNSITTPKGGTYQVTLPDGSKVWLNSASTLKYPSRFSGDSREVILEGEAYFDIVSMDRTRITDARKRSDSGSRASVMRVPFKVMTAGQTVEVLGTQFNLSAYSDEAEIKTTLVEGKVLVVVSALEGGRDGRGVIKELRPGSQSTVRGSQIEIREVDTEQYIAWKSGKFLFNNTPFRDMIAQVARWYDIDVVYEGQVPANTFSGDMKRSVSLMTVLDMLKISSIPFHIDGKKLIIE